MTPSISFTKGVSISNGKTEHVGQIKKSYSSKNLSKKKLMIYLLNKELKKRFCKCVRSVKFGKNKAKPGEEYPICYRSIYINRGIKPPKDVVKTCRKKKWLLVNYCLP